MWTIYFSLVSIFMSFLLPMLRWSFLVFAFFLWFTLFSPIAPAAYSSVARQGKSPFISCYWHHAWLRSIPVTFATTKSTRSSRATTDTSVFSKMVWPYGRSCCTLCPWYDALQSPRKSWVAWIWYEWNEYRRSEAGRIVWRKGCGNAAWSPTDVEGLRTLPKLTSAWDWVCDHEGLSGASFEFDWCGIHETNGRCKSWWRESKCKGWESSNGEFANGIEALCAWVSDAWAELVSWWGWCPLS